MGSKDLYSYRGTGSRLSGCGGQEQKLQVFEDWLGNASLAERLLQRPSFRKRREEAIASLVLDAKLEGWRPDEIPDLALLQVDSVALVEELLDFYNTEIGREFYLRTAKERENLRALAALLGYQPRPATSAFVDLALIVDGEDSDERGVQVPAGTAFRSEGGESIGPNGKEDVAPQVFESGAEMEAHPAANRWEVAPVHPSRLGDDIYLDRDSAALTSGQIALFTKFRSNDSLQGAFAREVQNAYSVRANDGQRYVRVDLVPTGGVADDKRIREGNSGAEINANLGTKKQREVELERVKVTAPSLTATIGSYLPISQSTEVTILNQTGHAAPVIVGSSVRLNHKRDFVVLTLDQQVSSLRIQDELVLQMGKKLVAGRVKDVAHGVFAISPQKVLAVAIEEEEGDVKTTIIPNVEVQDVAEARVTQVTFDPSLPGSVEDLEGIENQTNSLILHYNMVNAGRLVRPALTSLTPDQLKDGVELSSSLDDKVIQQRKGSYPYLLESGGARRRVEGTLKKEKGKVIWKANAGELESIDSLPAPISLYGNVLRASRGETIRDEVLGNGDVSQEFQSFELARGPLSAFDDAGAPDQIRFELKVTVSGKEWQRVSSFHGEGTNAHVYVIREEGEGEEQTSRIIFGNGKTGARLPTGINNVIAEYRVGSGALKPPVDSQWQVDGAVDDLRRVVGASRAFGGSDAESTEELRINLPDSVRLLDGRIVSRSDFRAAALRYSGVLQAEVRRVFDSEKKQVVTLVEVLSDNPEFETDGLLAYLKGMAPEGHEIKIVRAIGSDCRLSVYVEVKAGTEVGGVLEAIAKKLIQPGTGALAPMNLPVGGSLFASRIVGQVSNVSGVRRIEHFRLEDQFGNDVGPTGRLSFGETTEGKSRFPRFYLVEIRSGDQSYCLRSERQSPILYLAGDDCSAV